MIDDQRSERDPGARTGALRTATFTISIRGASADELETAAAAFVRSLHRAGLTPHDALRAWQRMDDWEERDFAPEAEPDAAWWRTMRIARDAALSALRAAGLAGEQRPFTIEPVAGPIRAARTGG